LKTPFITEFAASWGLLAGSLVIASPVVFFKIKEHVDIAEDLKFSDETFSEVAPTAELGDNMGSHDPTTTSEDLEKPPAR
jgi:hypothetical protein